MKGVFIGGGQDYYGPTADRDRKVVAEAARTLFSVAGNGIQIITGGMPGIPMDFATAWMKAGGIHVLCVISSEHEQEYLSHQYPFKHIVTGASQEARRLAVTKLPFIVCALFVQGGKYSTHEMKLFEEQNIKIVAHWGSGGAAGGGQPYQDWAYKNKPQSVHVTTTEPEYDHTIIAKELTNMILESIH